MKQELNTEEKIQKVETILKYYRLKGVNKKKCVDIKRKLLKEKESNNQ
jgi:hypothetical protein